MKAKPIKELIQNYLSGSNLKEINETICIEESWKEIVGKNISKNTTLKSFIKGTLIIKTSNPIWRNELSLQNQILLKKLKKIHTEIKVKKIIFR